MDCYFNTGYVYGTSSKDSKYSGIIGVGETWGYAMGYYMLNKKYGTDKDPDPKSKRWFKPNVTKELLDKNYITPLQFLGCMDVTVKDLTSLNSVLSSKYSKISKNLY